ncbi:hypothetical protein CTEN210_02845 [Chaetoceros tenuissimus]|uniref:RING-type E3 ubiquitin transferase n=1 Tax=Chaetoceros tenuissimus TaxID=426638 RepID=A0AAD3CK62_9STRA|nr:hypothetical protein CTEN210_02845 [Chaetoceros tenuissimus]
MNDETPTVTYMTCRKDENDDAIGARNNATQGNDKDEIIIRLGASEDTLIKFDKEKMDLFLSTMCRENIDLFHSTISNDWKQIENFLSNKFISNEEKRMVLQKHNSSCCRIALISGAPFGVIKGMIDLIDPKSPHFLTFGDLGSSWLHLALRFTKASMHRNRMAEKVPFDVIELLVSRGGRRLVNMQSDCKSDRGRTSLQLYLGQEEGHCPKIINLLLEVGGMELLEIEDKDGYSTRDISNETQRKIIIDYLKTLKECPRVQRQIEAFEDTAVTPKEFYLWNRYAEFIKVRTYLNDEKVSGEAKMKCINAQIGFAGRPFHWFCKNHGPLDIAEKFVDIMGKDFLFLQDKDGNNCLHKACDFSNVVDEHGNYVYIPTDRDIEAHCEFVAFLLSLGGSRLLLETNNRGDTALYNVMMCRLTNLECVKVLIKIGGYDLLAFQDEENNWRYGGNTILHYASWRHQPDREVIKYLVTLGGQRLMEIENNSGNRAEDDWSDELKEYLAFNTKTLPALSDDLQCPICFDTLYDVHVISQCCHRFCKECITQSYEKRGNTCPVCRAKFSLGNVKKDPLFGKLALSVKEEKDAKEVLQAQLSESQKEIEILRGQLQNAFKRKHDEL